jgi:hypothetical protein
MVYLPVKTLNTKDATLALAGSAREYTKGKGFWRISFVTFVSFVFKKVEMLVIIFLITLLMRGDEAIGIGQKRAETGLGAEVDDLAVIFCLWKKFGVGAEDAPAQRDKGGMFCLFGFGWYGV